MCSYRVGKSIIIKSMLRIIPLLFATLFTCVSYGQNELSWKKQRKLAEQQYAVGNYTKAALNFEKAWKKHSQSKELIFKAGECYTLLKDFKNAAQAYKQIKTDTEEFELVGLKYARALKQDGQYEIAKKELSNFIGAYQGDDKALLSQIVNTEIQGCDLALKLATSNKESTIEVRHLGENVNSLKTEFAPIPFAEDLLYYSSTIDADKAYLFRSQKKKGIWTKAVAAEGLPNLPNKHLANGSFAPDAKSFYFTLCDASSKLVSTCEIHVTKRVGSTWSAPTRLRDYINETGSTTTQPWVVHQNGKEILYFASNRKGGKGGMDIWYTSRDLNSGDIDFTYPINLGKRVNSIGDELTPFYDDTKGNLYFSSNGHAGLGGWDIFKVSGLEKKWEEPENLGLPINSSADDFYYVLKPSRTGGFLVSNRTSGAEKVSTQHEDIFEFGTKRKQQQFYVKGQIMEKESTADINNAIIALYEITGQKERLLQTKKSSTNNYQFPILSNRNYRLVIEKKGYLKNTFDFSTFQGNRSATHDFYLSKHIPTPSAPIAQNKPVPQNQTYTRSSTPSSTYTASNNSSQIVVNKPPTIPPSKSRIGISNPYLQGTYYKVQLIAVNYHNENHPRYRHVKNIARMETEAVPEKKVSRVLLANFPSKQEAKAILEQAKQYGFPDAFLVKYRDGQRIGTVWR